MEATLRFIAGAAAVDGVRLSVVSQDPADRIPAQIRHRLVGHWRINDGLDPNQIVAAVHNLQRQHGPVTRLLATLEQLQVPAAIAREHLGLPGLDVASAINFRDKSRMKSVLDEAGVPCARHAIIGDRQTAENFAARVGYPLVVKPPAGAGGKSTFRIDDAGQLQQLLSRFPPDPMRPSLFEQFMRGEEFSFDSVMLDGQMVWHSISRYRPSPLEVMENNWIQWTVLLPRDIDGAEFDPIRQAAAEGLRALGLRNGLSHMEWFRLPDGQVAVSEVGARPPGAQFTTLLSVAHDLDFYQAWPRLMVFDQFEPPPRRYAAGAAYIRGQGAGKVRHIRGLDEAQKKYGELVVEACLPQTGQPPSDSYEGDGYVILRHAETAVVEQALADIVRIIRVELE